MLAQRLRRLQHDRIIKRSRHTGQGYRFPVARREPPRAADPGGWVSPLVDGQTPLPMLNYSRWRISGASTRRPFQPGGWWWSSANDGHCGPGSCWNLGTSRCATIHTYLSTSRCAAILGSIGSTAAAAHWPLEISAERIERTACGDAARVPHPGWQVPSLARSGRGDHVNDAGGSQTGNGRTELQDLRNLRRP